MIVSKPELQFPHFKVQGNHRNWNTIFKLL